MQNFIYTNDSADETKSSIQNSEGLNLPLEDLLSNLAHEQKKLANDQANQASRLQRQEQIALLGFIILLVMVVAMLMDVIRARTSELKNFNDNINMIYVQKILNAQGN